MENFMNIQKENTSRPSEDLCTLRLESERDTKKQIYRWKRCNILHRQRWKEKKKQNVVIFIANLSHIKNETIRDLHVDKRKLPFKIQNVRPRGDPNLPHFFDVWKRKFGRSSELSVIFVSNLEEVPGNFRSPRNTQKCMRKK